MSVIVPVDSTEVSVNAVRYAYRLFPSSEIKIVHAVTGLMDPNDPMLIKPWIPKDISVKGEIERMLENSLPGPPYPELFEVEILFGETVPALKRHIDYNPYDAMVLGTRDKYDLFERWIGTVSLDVVKRIDLPIYLIPKYAKYHGFRRVVVASDYHLNDQGMVNYIRRWNTFGAFIKFVHVQEGPDDTFNQEEQSIFENLMSEGEPSFGFEVSVVPPDELSGSLLAIAYTEQADLLIAIPRKQNFFQSWLFGSLSKDLILKSSVPILFLAENSLKGASLGEGGTK